MTKQFTKEEIQLMDKMGSLASMLEFVFEPSNCFQVESKMVKVNNKYLLSLTAYKDMSDTVYCQAGFKLQVIRNYGKVPLYTVALNKVQAASHTEPYYFNQSFAHSNKGYILDGYMRHNVPPLIAYDALEELLLSGNMNVDICEVLNQGLPELLKYLFRCYGLKYKEG
jgi:hypothetical protein